MVSDLEIGYLAAFIDGEGTIDLHKLKKKSGVIYYLPRIRIANTHVEPLKFVKKSFNLDKKIDQNPYKVNNEIHIAFELSINKREEIKKLLLLVKDHLQIKNEQAELLLKYIDHREKQQPLLKELARTWAKRKKGQTTYTQEDEKYYLLIKKLNRRG